MSKKLRTSALALSFLLLGNITTYSDIPNGKRSAQPLPTNNPAAELYGLDDSRPLKFEKLQREVAVEAVDLTGATLTKSYVPTFTCEDRDNTCYPCGWAGLSFRNSGAIGGDVTGIGNRYEVEYNFICSLTGSWMFFAAIDGDIDAEIGVWTGAGGVPTTQVASIVVNSTALTADAWNFFDFSSLGLVFNQEDFYVSFGTVLGSAVDAGGPETDRIQSVVDNTGGTAPSSSRRGVTLDATVPGWTSNDLFWSQYYNQVASAVVCCKEIPFTNCILDSEADSYSSIFSLPSTANCRKGVAMRYSTAGFDTLVSAEIYLSNLFSGTDPDGEVILELLADNGSGIPDVSAPLAPALIVGGIGLGADLYPLGSFGWVDYPLNVVPGPGLEYHVAVRWIGPDPSLTGVGSGIGSDDVSAGEGSSKLLASVFFADGVIDAAYPSCPTPIGLEGWNNYYNVFGSNPDFLIDVNICKDEFIDCELIKSAANLTVVSTFLESEGFTGFSGRYNTGGDECRVDKARVYFYKWQDLDGLEIGIYSDITGPPNFDHKPGIALYSEIIPSSSFPLPANVSGLQWLDVFPNGGAGIEFYGGYHVVAKPIWTPGGANPLFSIILDDGSDGVRGHYEIGGEWLESDVVFGNGNNFVTESFRCCLPFSCCRCGPASDWPTYQHDQQRTGASTNQLGDANCDLNLLWTAQSSVGNSFSGSVIFGDKLIISNDQGFECRRISDGSLVWDQDTDPTVSSLFAGALSIYTQPTVATISTNSGPVQMTFLGTGLNRDVVAVNAQTGAYIWHNTTGFWGLFPTAKNVKSVVLNDGVDDILYYAVQTKLFAVTAKDGLPYAGWSVTNPVVMVADNANALTANETDFSNSQIISPVFSGAIAGDIYSFDAATGAMNWNLSTIVGAVGLRAEIDALPGYIGNEGFFSGASYDVNSDVFWCNSYFDADGPEEGYLYRIKANGTGYTATKSVRSRRATPVINENEIYVPAFSKWSTPLHSGEQVYSRYDGSFVHNIEGHVAGDRQYNDGVLTCEYSGPDYYIHGTELGELNFYHVGWSSDSLQFYRNTTLSGFNGGQWASGSLSPDALVFTNFSGLTVALGLGADRPRLSLPATRQDLPVPFGSPNGFDANFPGVIANSGCRDLVINGITFTDPSPPTGVPIEFSAVDPVLRAKMEERATLSTHSALFEKFNLIYGEAPVGIGPYESIEIEKKAVSSLTYRAATLPVVVDGASGDNGLLSPSAGNAIPPGFTVDLHIAINGPLVTRGPHDFVAHIDTNDPDYFLDDPSAIPAVSLRVIGGCLEDSVTMTFGVGGANSMIVFNDAKIQAFHSNGNNSIDIDGFGTGFQYFSGMRGWSLTPHRMAWTGPSWSFNGGWQTILADPNYCGNTCTPTVQSDVLLGTISSDNGATYDDVFGDVVALSYIDSARDYTNGGGAWDWESNPDEFLQDSTIGMFVSETHYGAHDVLALANLTVIRIDVTNRSLVNPLDDLQHFVFGDEDFPGLTQWTNGGAGFGYVFDANSGLDLHGWGVVGYGCDLAPRLRARNCDSKKFLFNTDVDPGGPFDSIYVWGRDPSFAGITSQIDWFSGDLIPVDAQSYFNFGGVSLAPGETKSMGLMHFAFSDASDVAVYDHDPFNPGQFEGMAALANKWAGFGRGDVNNDNSIDLADVVYLAGTVGGGNGAYPFAHLGDVNNDGAVDAADVAYLKDYYFNCGPCPVDDWSLGLCSP